MLYISGPNETLRELKEKEGYAGTLQEYERLFAQANPALCLENPNYKGLLPPYKSMFLVVEGAFDMSTKDETLKYLSQFSTEEMQVLRQLQEDGNGDLVSHVALTEVMEELQNYATQFRRFLKTSTDRTLDKAGELKQFLSTPFILTPWKDFNNALSRQSVFELTGETAAASSELLKRTTTYVFWDSLYNKMMEKDALVREWNRLAGKTDKISKEKVLEIKKKIGELEKEIRDQLPKKLSDKIPKNVHKRFTNDELKKMRARAPTPRSARKVQARVTNLDVLNKSGLGRLWSMIKGLKSVGGAVNAGTKLLNYGAVAYDTIDAYRTNGKVVRAFVAGAASVYVTTQITAAAGGTAALGGLMLGTLAGDAAVGATILICSPVIGWVVLIVTGIVVAGFITYYSKQVVEWAYDMAEYTGGVIAREADKALQWTHQHFVDAWNYTASWIPSFYGDSNR